jgi:hypothetical protein
MRGSSSRAHALALVLSVVHAALSVGCAGHTRFVLTPRGERPIPRHRDGELDTGRAFCDPICAFARRPDERVAGCSVLHVDARKAASLGLGPPEVQSGQSLVLCELR